MGTVVRNELHLALQKNDKLRALITEAKLNLDSNILEQLNTSKDGRVSWEELESHLTQAATVEAAAVEEKAEARLRQIFKLIASNKDDIVKKAELEGEQFKTMLSEARLYTTWELLEKVGVNDDKQVTWDKFYGKLKVAAEAVVRETGDLTVASVASDGTSTAATEINIEGEATSQRCFC